MSDVYVPDDVLRYVRTMPGCGHLTDDQIRQLAKHFQASKMAASRVNQTATALVPAKRAS